MWNFEIEKVVVTLLGQCDMFNCSIDIAWKEYMHPIITDQFSLDEVKQHIENNK